MVGVPAQIPRLSRHSRYRQTPADLGPVPRPLKDQRTSRVPTNPAPLLSTGTTLTARGRALITIEIQLEAANSRPISAV